MSSSCVLQACLPPLTAYTTVVAAWSYENALVGEFMGSSTREHIEGESEETTTGVLKLKIAGLFMLLQVYKNEVDLLPEELDEKLAELHIPHSVQSSPSLLGMFLLRFSGEGGFCRSNAPDLHEARRGLALVSSN